MSGPPLISVVTPTLNRPDLLCARCIPSVQAQTYPRVEHVVISDGPDLKLASALLQPGAPPGGYFAEHPLRTSFQFHCLPEQSGRCAARRRGAELARGDYIAYLDDDDAYRPTHLELLFELLMQHPEAGFAFSQMASHQPNGEVRVIGGSPLAPCHIGSPMILHRREILEVATWGTDDPMEDWYLVRQWRAAGVSHAFLEAVTCDVWPSIYWPENG